MDGLTLNQAKSVAWLQDQGWLFVFTECTPYGATVAVLEHEQAPGRVVVIDERGDWRSRWPE